jgi:3-dehydroquinate synthase II
LVPKGKSADVKKLGKITTISEDGDMVIGKDVEIVKITKKEDEAKVVALKGKIPAVIENLDWTIIPLENLISKTSNLIQSVSSPKEAKLALETMERGADGILLTPQSVNDILETGKIIEELSAEHFQLEEAEITESNLFL